MQAEAPWAHRIASCPLSCFYFESFASFVDWVVSLESGQIVVLHYLDDFLFVGEKDSNACEDLLQCFCYFANLFGIPLAPDKTVFLYVLGVLGYHHRYG